MPKTDEVFAANPDYKLSFRNRRHRFLMKIEKLTGWQFNRKHYKLIKA